MEAIGIATARAANVQNLRSVAAIAAGVDEICTVKV